MLEPLKHMNIYVRRLWLLHAFSRASLTEMREFSLHL